MATCLLSTEILVILVGGRVATAGHPIFVFVDHIGVGTGHDQVSLHLPEFAGTTPALASVRDYSGPSCSTTPCIIPSNPHTNMGACAGVLKKWRTLSKRSPVWLCVRVCDCCDCARSRGSDTMETYGVGLLLHLPATPSHPFPCAPRAVRTPPPPAVLRPATCAMSLIPAPFPLPTPS